MESQENKLRLEILGDARKKAEAIRARAERENAQRLEEMLAECGRQRDAALQELEAGLARERRKAANRTALEIRRRWLLEREQAIGAILQGVCAEAEGCDTAERQALLVRLAAEALDALGPGSYRVECAVCDVDLVTPQWLRRQTTAEVVLEVTPDATIRAGLRFCAVDGRVSFDNTIAARLAMLRGELRRLLASAKGFEQASEQGAGSHE